MIAPYDKIKRLRDKIRYSLSFTDAEGEKDKEDEKKMSPLVRTGRLFGGLINDIKCRLVNPAKSSQQALHQCRSRLIFSTLIMCNTD